MNVFRRLEREETEAILRWTYESPYDLYNHRPADRDMLLREFLEAENFYFALLDEQDDLVAYCCYGTSARVNGGDYSVEALDLGLTVRPDLTGRGLGSSFAEGGDRARNQDVFTRNASGDDRAVQQESRTGLGEE